MTRPVNLYVWPVQGWCVFGKREGMKRAQHLSPIFATEDEAERFLDKLLADDEDILGENDDDVN
ncbi:MAG: hypothetical protein J6M06_00470 [Synergistaceae bacterium]|nr:hypothetical protein [Synergistaceae bacterium]